MDNIDSTGRNDDVVAGGFDQTNDLAGNQLGESDGTAQGEQFSAAERTGGDDSLLDTDDDRNDGAEKSEGVRGDGDVFPGNLPGNPARGGSGGI